MHKAKSSGPECSRVRVFLSEAKQLKKRFLGDEFSGRSLIDLVTWTIYAKISIQGKSSKKHLYLFWRKGSGLFLIISED